MDGSRPGLAASVLLALVAALLPAACAGAPANGGALLPNPGREPGRLPGTEVSGEVLSASALASEAAFHFPDETRALVRGLLRSEFARREALRLGLEADPAVLDESLGQALEGIREQLADDETLEEWARERYGRSAAQVEDAVRERLRSNQLYQLTLRADARGRVRYRVQMLVSLDEAQARGWARKLEVGADPRKLAPESADPGPHGDATFPPLPEYLPQPLGTALEAAAPGETVGPFQLEGDSAWRVVRLVEKLEPTREVPPVSVLIEELRAEPLSALEARAWFEEMVRRYTAEERLPGIQAPTSAFVPAERL